MSLVAQLLARGLVTYTFQGDDLSTATICELFSYSTLTLRVNLSIVLS